MLYLVFAIKVKPGEFLLLVFFFFQFELRLCFGAKFCLQMQIWVET